MATWGRAWWPAWLIIVLITLLAPEIYALATNPANTLSDWVWRALGVAPGQHVDTWSAARLLTLCVWLTLTGWLTWHFWFGLFR